MNPTKIGKTILEANAILNQYGDLDCFLVWRSTGSIIYFEFGMPSLKRVTPVTRPAFTVARGEASIGLCGDRWSLLEGANVILSAESVDECALKHVIEPALLGNKMPIVELNQEGILTLAFRRDISIAIQRSDCSDPVPGDHCDELTIKLPNYELAYCYDRGFYLEVPAR